MMAEVVSQMGAGLRENCKHAVVPKQKSLNLRLQSINPLKNVVVNCFIERQREHYCFIGNCSFSEGARLCTACLYLLIFLNVFVAAENSNLRRIKINLI